MRPSRREYAYEDIYAFLASRLGITSKRLLPDTSISDDLGVEGDDFAELMSAFARQFDVDMSSYRWYFHHVEEGIFSIGGLFFPPPSARVDRILVSPELLLKSANAGTWELRYPEHTLPRRRYDLIINTVLGGATAVLALYAVSRRFLR